jgi:outer membrane protein W
MQLKFLRSTLLLPLALCVGASFANAQSGLDVFFGVGTTSVSSNGQSLNTFGDGNLFGTPSMSGAFGKAGADYLITPHLGIGAETDFRFSQGAYAGLTYRPTFYDFNVIWLPTANHIKRVVPELQAGIGGTRVSFFLPNNACNAFTGCNTSSQFLDSSNHFQTHLEAGIRFYVTPHLFIRPQIDAHYVNNFFQFGSNWVPEYGASLGWSFGER